MGKKDCIRSATMVAQQAPACGEKGVKKEKENKKQSRSGRAAEPAASWFFPNNARLAFGLHFVIPIWLSLDALRNRTTK